ncbi:tRNA (adenosine(37)-N6)-threonylcarbamoyltransferase complex dimerization subunit type 1 TsaB [soil metagenome]
MKILVLDTSTEACSAALFLDGIIKERYQLAPRQQTALILPMIDSLLAEAEIKLNQLDALAFGRGPGSFTGVRIAASVVQGLAFAADLPVVPISTLRAMAQGAYRQLHAQAVLSCLDARMQQVYWAASCIDAEGIMQLQAAEIISNPGEVTIPFATHWIGVGNGWQEYAACLQQALGIGRVDMPAGESITIIEESYYPQSRDIALLAAAEYLKGNAVAAELALPIYLRDAVR